MEALLRFKESGAPESVAFDDIYFDSENGLDETRYVFLEQNRLNERWDKPHFSVGELGFGTGLNFFATWDLWKKSNHRPKRLHFVSCEKYPLSKKTIQQTLSRWPELKPYVQEFLNVYEPMPWGMYRFVFEEGGVQLTLLYGDVLDTWKQVDGKFDAWFFDGFSPKKNERMWEEEIFHEVAKRTKKGGTFSTFTAAGHVKRKLQEVGFETEKFSGYGKKREMLRGVFKAGKTCFSSTRTALIVGGGLAGCSLANRLAARGWEVCLLEKNPSLAQEASGNPLGILVPSLTIHPSAISTASLQSLIYSEQLISHLAQKYDFGWKACGSLLLLNTEKKETRYQKILENQKFSDSLFKYLNPKEASAVAGIKISYPAFYIQRGGFLEPALFCKSLIEQYSSKIKLKLNSIYSPSFESEFDFIFYANAYDANQIPALQELAIEKIRGQILHLNTDEKLTRLKTILYFDGYLSPVHKNAHLLGSTFDKTFLEKKTRCSDSVLLLEKLKKFSPDFRRFNPEAYEARAQVRTHTKSRLPFISAVNSEKTKFVLSGLGSKGISYAPYGAEILSSMVSDEPLPAQCALMQLLDFRSKKFNDLPPIINH